jgi:kumamolisin
MTGPSHTLIVEPDDGRTAVLQALNAAKRSIDLTIYELSDPQIVAALTAAKGRGVTVRVIYNWYSFSSRTQETDITPTITTLTQAGIECREAPKIFEVTHEKAFVIDAGSAVIMSFNLTADYFGQTRDFGIITTIPAEVAEVETIFNGDWIGQPAAPNAAALLWSPVNARAKLMALIHAATKTLDVYCEEAEDPGVLGALVSAAQRGVAVRFIAAVLSTESKVNGNARGVTTMLTGGVQAVCKSFLYIHAKMILADFGAPSAQAYIGSENFSCVSLNDNRECGILVTEPAILQRLETVFRSDWAQPSVAVTPDPTALAACAGNAAERTRTRLAQRALAFRRMADADASGQVGGMNQSDQTPASSGERPALPGARKVGNVGADERVELTIHVRRRRSLPAELVAGKSSPKLRTYLTIEQLERDYGADPADLRRVEDFVQRKGLVVVESHAGRRRLVVAGSAAACSDAFQVDLENWEHPLGTYRTTHRAAQVPADLTDLVVGIFGLDTRPFARPHFKRLKPHAGSAFAGYTPAQVAQFYNFPTGVDGTGQTVGIIELGGGYRPADLQTYAKEIGVPAPQVTAVSVDHGRNSPTTAEGADGEVMLDIEVIASIAPGAKIVVYFAPGSTDKDFLDAVTQAVHDQTHQPSIISISWGGPESTAEASFQTELDAALQSAAAVGITVTVASGDSGAADVGPNEWNGQPSVDFPASSPHVLACGATSIAVSSNAITAESVWNQNSSDTQDDSFGASGGGVSTVFPLPAFQADAKVPVNLTSKQSGRGVPDVSGDGDPATGYRIRVDGQEFPIGGTSAVAPLWAGLLALINQSIKTRTGFINPLLYANPSVLRDITHGNNEVGPQKVGYAAGPGWDACTGLGSPDGRKLLALLQPPAHPQFLPGDFSA